MAEENVVQIANVVDRALADSRRPAVGHREDYYPNTRQGSFGLELDNGYDVFESQQPPAVIGLDGAAAAPSGESQSAGQAGGAPAGRDGAAINDGLAKVVQFDPETTTQPVELTSFYPINSDGSSEEEAKVTNEEELRNDLGGGKGGGEEVGGGSELDPFLEFSSPWDIVQDEEEMGTKAKGNELLDWNPDEGTIQNFMTEPKTDMMTNLEGEYKKSTSAYEDAGINPEKLAYILIGVSSCFPYSCSS